MAEPRKPGKSLTVQVHHGNLDPRTFQIPVAWISRAGWIAWILALTAIFSSVYAIRTYFADRSARPELVTELENEIQNLKIALEKKSSLLAGSPSSPQAEDGAPAPDPNASTEKPVDAPGIPIEGKDGVWSGLADQIKLPAPGQVPAIRLQDAKLEWKGKYALFSLNVQYQNPGKGVQQGHLVVLGRSGDRLFAHPDGVLNVTSGASLFDANRGEYFSVSHFRVLRARFGPFESQEQLQEIQVFAFDLNNHLILVQTFRYGK